MLTLSTPIQTNQDQTKGFIITYCFIIIIMSMHRSKTSWYIVLYDLPYNPFTGILNTLGISQLVNKENTPLHLEDLYYKLSPNKNY